METKKSLICLSGIIAGLLTFKSITGAAATTLIETVITAPTESKVQVFNQLKNYCVEEVEYASKTDSDGVSSYTYNLPKGNGRHTYRVTMDGKITKAGYLKLTSADTAKTDITFAENENPKIRPDYDTTTTIGSRLEDNIMLNINEQNYLRLNKGETFKVRAYRTWQIINSDTANVMIEPDFEYKIISGDSVSISQQGQNAVIEAVKDGVSVIEVTYNAIEIGGNTKYGGIYGAIDPMRKGMFIVNCGGSTDTKIIMPVWDSDFDTVYFTSETGTYNFRPESETEMSVFCNGKEVTAETDGSYNLPLNQGNNIVCVKSGETEEYTVIKGKRPELEIKNITAPGEKVKQGDTVEISFKGLHMPVPKFAGIYNPGLGNTVKLTYTDKNGETVTGKGAQYNFINSHKITLTVYEKGKYTLNNGVISLTSMGYPPGTHRTVTDEGIGANFNASSVNAVCSMLPDISFDVQEYNGIFEKNITSDGENITVSFINTAETELDFYVAAYDEEKKLQKLKKVSQSFAAGENSIDIPYAEFADMQDIRFFAWDKDMKPVMHKEL